MNRKIIFFLTLVMGFFFLVSSRSVRVPDTTPFIWLYEDKFIHFLSGVVIAWCFKSGFKIANVLTIIFLTVMLGIGWEIYENVFILAFDLKETAFDIIFDVFGCGVYLIAKRGAEYIGTLF